MKITCPHCETAYDIGPAALGSGGRQVRCARCQNVWFAELGETPTGIVPADMGGDDPGPSAEMAFVKAVRPPDSGSAEATGDAGDAGEPQPAEPPTAAARDADEEADAATGTTGQEQPEAADAADETPASPRSEMLLKAPAPDRKPSAAAAPAVNVEALASHRPTARRPKRRPHPVWHARGLTAAIVLLFLIDATLIVGRAEVVRMLPQTARLYETIGLSVNLRDLTFKDIKMTQEQHEGAPILVIEGTIVVTGWKPVDVPRLRFAISAANGHEIYAWTALPTRAKLAPGEVLPFRTRLASPPEQGRTVKIRFFNRRDIATGLR